ncbi:MAG: hypothetical protein HZB63_10280, partial [Deltaproteobacteria bacterium]|nr:hypothetical protein [Deltaproteobacteria bacterium]
MRNRQATLRTGAGFLALFVLAVFLLGVYFDQVATRAVNGWLSSAFPVPATVQKVKVRLLAGTVEVAGLRIANPSGFAHREFLTLRKGEMDLRRISLWTDEIVAESIRTEGLVVRLERIEGRQNTREIFPSVPRKDLQEKSGKRFRIRRLVFLNTLLSYPVAGGEQHGGIRRGPVEDLVGDLLGELAVARLPVGVGELLEMEMAVDGLVPQVCARLAL